MKLAAPLIIGQLTNVAMVFVDTVMAGHLGAEPLGAVAIGGSLWSSVILFLIGTLLAVTSFVSQYDGAGQRKRIAALMRQVYWVALLLAGLSMLAARNLEPILTTMEIEPRLVPQTLGYLDAISWGAPAMGGYLALRFLSDGLGLTRPTMYFGLLGLALNVPANYVLMYGKLGFPALGATGCGYATAFVLTAQFFSMLLWVRFNPAYRGLPLIGFSLPRWPRIVEILRVGLPIGAAFFIESSLFVVATLLMGSIGTNAVAGHQVALNFAALWFMIPLGISMAITVRVGNAAGRRDHVQVRQRGFHGMGLILMTQLLSMALMLSVPGLIASVYTSEAAVLSVAVPLIMIAGIFQLPDGIQVAAFAALRGIKDTRQPMLLMVTAYWAIGIPLSYTFGIHLGFGPKGVWWGMIAGLSVAAALLVLRFSRQTAWPEPKWLSRMVRQRG